ncbi:MAG: DUF72 domain-containing protein [Candidatus Saccharimonas sp.]|nr:DUF72 domain-containing protein [Planctomycetaceae bacterium]
MLPYFLGCPAWAHAPWVGRVFPKGTKRGEFLRRYSMLFNSVEGNATFYGMPTLDTVRRWADESLPGFRFALKFPRVISHERQLVGAESETRFFLSVLEILHQADRLGPSFLQLSPSFSGAQLPALAAYLRELPPEFPYAVEVRHSDYFDHGSCEHSLDELLLRLHVDRALFDSRALFSAAPVDKHEEEARRRKPNSPLRQTATGPRPMLRFVGRNDIEASRPWLSEWVPVVADWLAEGRTPYVFLHTPDDLYAPDLARAFHLELSKRIAGLPPLPSWPSNTANVSNAKKQLELF